MMQTICMQGDAGVNRINSGNMDEVPVSFDLPSQFTVGERTEMDVSVTITGFEKCSFTVVLVVTRSGNKYLLIATFKRKAILKERSPSTSLSNPTKTGRLTN